MSLIPGGKKAEKTEKAPGGLQIPSCCPYFVSGTPNMTQECAPCIYGSYWGVQGWGRGGAEG